MRLFTLLLTLIALSAFGQVDPKPSDFTINTGATYSPDHLWMFMEGTGTTVADEIGSADLTISGADWATDGTHGDVLDFVSANSDFADTNIASWPTTSLTAYVVARMDATQAQATIGFADESEPERYMHGMTLFDGDSASRINTSGGIVEANTSTDVSTGAYFLLSYKFNSSDATGASVDGAAFTTASGSGGFWNSSWDTIAFGHVPDSSPSLPADMRVVAGWVYFDSEHSDTDVSNVWNSGDVWSAIGVEEATADFILQRRRLQ